MNYEFKDVKELFDRFNINYVDGKYIIVERGTSIPYEEKELVAKVKFAHSWVKATEYNRSRTTSELSIVTEQDYYYAFNEMAKSVYDAIMAYSQDVLRSTGRFYSPEVLKKEVEEAVPTYKYSGSIVQGLYQSERFAKSFEDWVRFSTRNPDFYPIEAEKSHGVHK